ncbi:MAG: FG-GAP repeat domain-containing protein [Bacteroidota bacterium]
MKHIEEHILELYVLGSEKITDRRDEIAAHLKECNGCRHLTAQMAEFYRTAEAELKNIPNEERDATSAVATVPRDVQRLYQPTAPAIPLKTPTRIERFGIFVRRSPFAAGAGGVTLFGALAMTISFSLQSIKDTNPANFFLNRERSTLQILDSTEQLLWERIVENFQRSDSEVAWRNRLKQVRVTDLDGDGRNEVVTTLLLLDDKLDIQHNVLRIFSAEEVVLARKDLSHEFQYENREYTRTLRADQIIVDDFDGNGKKEIIVMSANIRSPSSIVRLDEKGNELGRFWHFGHFLEMEARDIDNDGRLEILAGGSNDIGDKAKDEFPGIVVLKPEKIIGHGKSSVCAGFHFPTSAAEMYYIRLPIPDIHAVFRQVPSVIDFYDSDSTHMLVSSFCAAGGTFSGFNYVLTNDMRILEVKFATDTGRFHAKLKQEGKITSTLDKAYLENLRQGVRYWDGKEWVKEPTKIKHRTE